MRCGPLIALITLVACIDDTDEAELETLALAARSLAGSGALQAIEVPEGAQGQTDLNGDGDALDHVLHVLDLDTGSLRNLRLAAVPDTTAAGSRLVAFAVSEADQANGDRNGDGDALDRVLHVHDALSGVTTNTELATPEAVPPSIGISSVAFLVGELEQGDGDLNGDGDTSDLVLHVYDARTGLTTNAQRAATSFPLFHDHAFAFTTDEPSAGADLNGDGDQLDLAIFELFDLLIGGVEQTPLAILDMPLAVNVDDWCVLVDEDAQELDLNGDGDQLDGVWFEVDPHGGLQTPLGFSSKSIRGSTDDGVRLALVHEEIDGLDANGDGDELDDLVFLHDPDGNLSFAPGLAVAQGTTFALADGRLVFAVDEASHELDLNGNFDLTDQVLHTLDVANGNVSNRALAIAALADVGENVLLWLDELQIGTDQNGDGDELDLVLAKLQPESGTVVSLGLASAPPLLAANQNMAVVAVSESDQRQDLNFDGDQLDEVAYRIDVVFPIEGDGGLLTNLRAAVEGASVLPDGRGLLRVSETAQGRDLNGDGDLLDLVVVRFE